MKASACQWSLFSRSAKRPSNSTFQGGNLTLQNLPCKDYVDSTSGNLSPLFLVKQSSFCRGDVASRRQVVDLTGDAYLSKPPKQHTRHTKAVVFPDSARAWSLKPSRSRHCRAGP